MPTPGCRLRRLHSDRNERTRPTGAPQPEHVGSTTLRGDDRGQAIQIGAVLVFAILVVALALYQGVVVPAQNEEVEFDHSQEVERAMVDVRGELLRAGTTGEAGFASVPLGTELPARLIAQNPQNPGGTLETTDNRTVSVDADGFEAEALFDTAENRALEYRPNYAEYREAGTIQYEHTVVYHAFDDANVLLSGQRLLEDGRISLVALQGELRETGTGAASVEPVAGRLESTTVTDPIVELETGLDEADWQHLLEDEINADDALDADDVTVTDGVLVLALTGEYELEYAAIGVNRTPPGGDRASQPAESPGERSAFDVTWDEATIATEPGVEARQDGLFEYNASAALERTGSERLTLTAATDTGTDGAAITYAVGDTAVGTVDETDTTDGGIETTTTFDPDKEGTVFVFVAGGGTGDRLQLEVTDVPE